MFNDDKQLLAALARLHRSPDFDKFMNIYIAGLLTEQSQLCIDQPDPARAQGAAQVLQRIQKDVEEAESGYYKLTEHREVPIS